MTTPNEPDEPEKAAATRAAARLRAIWAYEPDRSKPWDIAHDDVLWLLYETERLQLLELQARMLQTKTRERLATAKRNADFGTEVLCQAVLTVLESLLEPLDVSRKAHAT